MKKMNKLVNAVVSMTESVECGVRRSLTSHLIPPPSSLIPPRSFLLALLLLALLLPQAAKAQYIQETMTLAKGWNAIYLESEPETPACDEFFKDMPVTKVMRYCGKDYVGSPKLDDNGNEILQPPITYNSWIRGNPSASTLNVLVGGSCYLVFATEGAEKTFLGRPTVPDIYWRETSDTNDLMNVAGVSSRGKVDAKAYFGEGPFDGKYVFTVGGEDKAYPVMRQMIGSKITLESGKAYSLSAKEDGEWPGVIGLVGWNELQIMGGYGTLRVRNNSGTNRIFRMTMVKSAKSEEIFPPLQRLLPRTDIEDDDTYTNVAENVSWDVSIDGGETELLRMMVDPSALAADKTYAAVLEIEDKGGSGMRVRVPVSVVQLEAATDAQFPTGIWGGTMAFDKVSSLTNPVPIPAAGVMALNVIMFVSPSGTVNKAVNGRVRLLQRATVAAISNGTGIVYRDLADVPAENRASARRLFTGMMSVDTPQVDALPNVGSSNLVFGAQGDLTFAWKVPERARDNPFRHAWHPDHDGLSADYSTQLPTGDDYRNYAMPVKPELWSIGNVLALNFKSNLTQNADETAEGTVTWDVGGLVSTNMIHATGYYRLKRLIPVAVMQNYVDGE